MRPVRAFTKKRTLSPFKKNKMRAVGNLNACGTEGPIPALFRDGRAYPLFLNLLYALSESLARFLRKSLAKSCRIGENLKKRKGGTQAALYRIGRRPLSSRLTTLSAAAPQLLPIKFGEKR